MYKTLSYDKFKNEISTSSRKHYAADCVRK